MKQEEPKIPKPSERICVIGEIARPVICEAFNNHKEELLAKYPSFLAKKAKLDAQMIEKEVAAKLCEEADCSYFEEMGEGGIYDLLWQLSLAAKKGFRVEVRDIPLSVAAVEISEFAGINPYESDSKGTFLAVTSNSGELIRKFNEKGIKVTDIGYISGDNDKLLVNKDHIGYLNKRR